MKRPHLLREIVEIVAITVLFFFLIRLLTQSYHVNDASMQPGLSADSYVMINKQAYLFRPPQRGDVIVFHLPTNTNIDYIRRIIGLPGDTVQIDGTQIKVNNTVLREPYVSASATPIVNTWKVPPDQYFVLGDNRPSSEDSRYWGPIPKTYIVGKAIFVYWPTDKLKIIDTPNLAP
ncbi:signal peptidase I [Reticulibacter mediterranei]|uniref:Signal peptidase I n=1 Tax=Reticulibacter mediterranei TaxID=2778369 RepID=A0A8J3IIN5_9CHLR|nr:signal peptidase I [Reticulibacter mediterranei]GHO93155.1 signal peptidase I [Reticulibacter mediterranei]